MANISPLIQSPPLNLTRPLDPTRITSFRNKTVLITGGASGIGAAIARSWASRGANIVIADVDDAKGEELVAELRLISGPQAKAKRVKGSAAIASSSPEQAPEKHHYIHTSVLSFSSLASCFRLAASLSPSGTIDHVLANAGIGERPDVVGGLVVPASPSALLTAGLPGCPEPPAPDLRVLETNLTGVAWTVHLALFWLAQPPVHAGGNTAVSGSGSGGEERDNSRSGVGGGGAGDPDDKSVLLIGSVASLIPLPATPQYTASKHAVLGLFRSLRGLPAVVNRRLPSQGQASDRESQPARQGIRINLLLPYFIDTPIIPLGARLLLAGGGLSPVASVVDAATRLVGDPDVRGRALVVGPKLVVKAAGGDGLGDGEIELVEVCEPEDGDGGGGGGGGSGVGGSENSEQGQEAEHRTETETRSLWEVYAHDYDGTEAFVRRFVRLLDRVETMRGWVGWGVDVARALVMPVVRRVVRR